MRKQQTNDSSLYEETVDTINLLLLDLLETAKAYPWEEYAKATHAHVTRPPWPGANLSKEKKNAFMCRLLKLARPFAYVKNRDSIALFARQATQDLFAEFPHAPHSGLSFSGKNLKRAAWAILNKELLVSDSGQLAVNRTAIKLFHQAKGKKHGGPSLSEKDPLRSMLGLLSAGPICLPQTDIRTHILKSTAAHGLISLLRKAAPFAPHNLREALGDELYELAVPTGFVDQSKLIVRVEVGSSIDSHEAHYRKQEIISALKALPEFRQITELRIAVRASEMR